MFDEAHLILLQIRLYLATLESLLMRRCCAVKDVILLVDDILVRVEHLEDCDRWRKIVRLWRRRMMKMSQFNIFRLDYLLLVIGLFGSFSYHQVALIVQREVVDGFQLLLHVAARHLEERFQVHLLTVFQSHFATLCRFPAALFTLLPPTPAIFEQAHQPKSNIGHAVVPSEDAPTRV